MVIAAYVLVTALLAPSPVKTKSGSAKGIVFDDKNLNNRRDSGEPGIKGVRVSNQIEVVTTDGQGKWSLPVRDDCIFFVIKPRGWMTAVDKDQIPQFFYIHKPSGSPKVKYGGVVPTGPLPSSIDFPLHRQPEPSKFKALFFGDTQPRDLREVEYISHDIVEPLVGTKDFTFGVTLGDIAFDNLDTFRPLNACIAMLGIPWYNVLGNHDINYDVEHDQYSDETFESIYGPNYYSFDYGPTHFVVIDDVIWHGPNTQPNKKGKYTAGLGAAQLDWIRKDLESIPKNQLVVLMMHIPIYEIAERAELYRLIQQRPYCISVSAHTHYQEHRFLKKEDGYNGSQPHHHIVNVTTCGSWWQGAPDERGIPHTTMRDGAPNGYSIFTFDGNQYSIDFRAARRSPEYQVNIIAPESVVQLLTPGTPIFANVFGGSERSTVEISIGEKGTWIPMRKTLEQDPEYAQAYERDKNLARPYRALPAPMNSPHLWKSALPNGLAKGVHPIHVRTVDMFGQTFYATRSIRIE